MQATRAQLRAISENSTDVIVIVDADSRIRYANPVVESHFGYTPAELEGELLTTLMPERHCDKHLAAIGRYLETGERTLNWSNVEFHGKHRDGTETPLSVSFSEYETDGGVRLVGSMRDISERVKIEEVLREREAQFRQMAENIEEIVWMTNPEKTEIVYVNPAYEEIWGQTIQRLYDDPAAFLELVHDEDRERVGAAIQAQADGSYNEKYRICRPDGELRWVHDRAVPVKDDTGEVYRIVGVTSDITDRKRRQQELTRVQELLEHTERLASVGGWEIDTDSMEVFWCENLFELLGVDAEVEPPLEAALDLYHEEDRPVIEGAIETALESGEPFDVRVRLERPDGEIRQVRVKGVPMVEDGEVVTLRGALQDLTEL